MRRVGTANKQKKMGYASGSPKKDLNNLDHAQKINMKKVAQSIERVINFPFMEEQRSKASLMKKKDSKI